MLKRIRILPLVAASLLLASCALLPEEEVFSQSPVIDTYVAESFTFAYVERGDVVLSEKVSCTYVPAHSQSYRFGVSNEYFDEIYVHVGDTVAKGQLLAQLDVAAYDAAVTNVKASIARIELQIAHLEENRAVALSRAGENVSPSEAAKAREDINKAYDEQLLGVNDALYIQQKQLAEYEYQRSRRQIFAGFDGTVTFVREVKDGDVSSTYESVVTIADSATTAFQTQTDKWTYLHVGDEYVITVSGKDYDAVVVDETELGLSPVERKEGAKAYVYLALKETTFELEDGDRGSFVLVMDRRDDVLKLPATAIGTLGGENVVYYQDEQGTKRYKTVVTGLTGGKETEIIEGVSEGDAVIVE